MRTAFCPADPWQPCSIRHLESPAASERAAVSHRNRNQRRPVSGNRHSNPIRRFRRLWRRCSNPVLSNRNWKSCRDFRSNTHRLRSLAHRMDSHSFDKVIQSIHRHRNWRRLTHCGICLRLVVSTNSHITHICWSEVSGDIGGTHPFGSILAGQDIPVLHGKSPYHTGMRHVDQRGYGMNK